MVMSNEKSASLETTLDEEELGTRKIILHVYDDESKAFVTWTTYHGMVRIYNSLTWPSLIFWCLIVTSCVGLFMVHSGYLFFFYQTKPTFLDSKLVRKNFPKSLQPIITICERHQHFPSFKKMKHSKPNCSSLLTQVKIDHKSFRCNDIVVNHDYSLFGSCYSLSTPSWSFANRLHLVVNRSVEKDIAIEIHEKRNPSNIFARGIHVLRSIHLMTQVSAVAQEFLDKKSWGRCNGNQSLESCQKQCLKNFLLAECKCLAFNHATNGSLCKDNDIPCIFSVLPRIKPCNCSLPCSRVTFSVQQLSMSKLPLTMSNYSKITVEFTGKRIIEQRQRQRLKTVDLLSLVAGSMGLFLGMSCITLLEVFMYLFKAVWGTMNNARYKAYLSKLLGENVQNLLQTNPDISQSHEQIVITQIADANLSDEKEKITALPPVLLQIKNNLLKKKRFSIQIGTQEEQMIVLPSQQRFRAQSHRGFLPSFESWFEFEDECQENML